jgi:hypothetical protein
VNHLNGRRKGLDFVRTIGRAKMDDAERGGGHRGHGGFLMPAKAWGALISLTNRRREGKESSSLSFFSRPLSIHHLLSTAFLARFALSTLDPQGRPPSLVSSFAIALRCAVFRPSYSACQLVPFFQYRFFTTAPDLSAAPSPSPPLQGWRRYNSFRPPMRS